MLRSACTLRFAARTFGLAGSIAKVRPLSFNNQFVRYYSGSAIQQYSPSEVIKRRKEKEQKVNQIPIDRDLVEFKEFEQVPRRKTKFIYNNMDRTPRNVFLEKVSDNGYNRAKSNLQSVFRLSK